MLYTSVILATLSSMAFAIPQATATVTDCTITSAIPTCGVPCLAAAATLVGCPEPTDYACKCSHSAEVQSSAIGCILSACNLPDALAVSSAAAAVCTQCV